MACAGAAFVTCMSRIVVSMETCRRAPRWHAALTRPSRAACTTAPQTPSSVATAVGLVEQPGAAQVAQLLQRGLQALGDRDDSCLSAIRQADYAAVGGLPVDDVPAAASSLSQ